jgi:iron complex transport system permease protein
LNQFYKILPWILLPVLLFLDLFFTRDQGLSFAISESFSDFRIPRIVASIFAGIALAGSGLALQTLFRNPLAGPFLTGITPGASFAIGMLLLAFPAGMALPWMQQLGLAGAGMLGGICVLLLQLYISRKQTGIFTLLLTGVMLGYLLGAGVEIMQTLAGAEQIKSFVMWGLGNFDRVQAEQLTGYIPTVILGLALIFLLRFRLDAWLPGEMYARNAGVNVKNFRIQIILIAGLLAGATTALCGPVGFIGLAAPHLARLSYRSNNHGRIFLPVLIWGAVLCLAADLVAHNLLKNITLNINAIAAFMGAPVVLWVLLRKKNR